MSEKYSFDKHISIKDFLKAVVRFQELYQAYDNKLASATATEVESIAHYQNRIAEDFARYILSKNLKVEILNNIPLGKILDDKA